MANDRSLTATEQRKFHELAIKEYSTAIKNGIQQRDARISAHAQRGKLYLMERNYSDAIPDFTEVVREGAAGWEIYTLRGQSYDLLGQWDLALSDYNSAISHGADGIVYEYRGRVLFELGQYEAAVADYTKLLSVAPYSQSWKLYESRGDAYVACRAIIRAGEDYKSALRLLHVAEIELTGRVSSANEINPNADRLNSKLKQLPKK
jgi:tetratricopeptide (TPR) repeat protein